MQIKINDTVFDKVAELNIERDTRRTELRYNTRGDLLIDLVNRKYEVDVVFGLLTEKELRELRSLTAEIFVTVTLNAPEGEITEEFHVSDEPAPTVTEVNGVIMYSGVKLHLKQK